MIENKSAWTQGQGLWTGRLKGGPSLVARQTGALMPRRQSKVGKAVSNNDMEHRERVGRSVERQASQAAPVSDLPVLAGCGRCVKVAPPGYGAVPMRWRQSVGGGLPGPGQPRLRMPRSNAKFGRLRRV